MLLNKVPYDFSVKQDSTATATYSKMAVDIMLHGWETSVVKIPDGVKKIRSYCFYDCWPGEPFEITVPEGCTEICSLAFANCDINSVTLPSTITTIAADAFADASPNSITINKPANSIPGFPWGADNTPTITWKG